MSKIKGKVFFIIIGILMVFTVFVVDYRYMIQMDYFVLLRVPCDPVSESCYQYSCDAEEECGDSSFPDTYFFKEIKKKAYLMKECVLHQEGCLEQSCAGLEDGCEERVCDAMSEDCVGPGFLTENMRSDEVME